MFKSNAILALDIGSSKVSAVLALVNNRRIGRLFFDSLPSRALSRGSVSDSLNLIAVVESIISNLRNKSGVKNIPSVYVNISGSDILTRHSHAIIPLAERGNKIITRMDLYRVTEQARILGSCLEEEIVHQLAASYAIDSKDNIVNPVGLYSHRLEADVYLVCVKTAAIESLNSALAKAGCSIRGVVFSGLATSMSVFGAKVPPGEHVLCDVGSDITEILFFKDGLLKDIKILNAGGKDLTDALAAELKMPFELAEDVKRSHGLATDPSLISADKEVLIKKENGYRAIKQKLICEIVSSKTTALCNLIKENIEKNCSSTQLDSFSVCGRSVLLEGFLESLEATLGIPVKLSRINCQRLKDYAKTEEQLSAQKYLSYLTALGMINRHFEKGEILEATKESKEAARSPISRAVEKIKEVYQEYF